MPRDYDLITIGSGSAASTAARKCREAGWSVAVIDHLPFGGTCALRGCDPKKVLVAAAESLDRVRRLKGHGISGDVRIDWAELMAFKRTFVENVPERRERALRQKGIDPYHGRARFVAEDTIAVNEERLRGRHILIAAGAVPAPLPVEGAEHLITSTDFLELETLPGRIAFAGGGFISMEFAHVAARAGARVTVYQRGEHILPGFEPTLSDRLTELSRSLGIDVRTGAEVQRIERMEEGYRVHAAGSALVEADLVVHGGGRVPDLADLDLEAAGVAASRRGVAVSAYLQSTTNARVYAAGDAADTDGLPLTPTAAMESNVVAANLLKGNHRTADYRGTASVVFTVPPLAAVGLTEAEAVAAGCDYEVVEQDISGWYAHRRTRDEAAIFRVLVDRGADRVLGAHLLGEGAEELINLFALAIRFDLPASELRHVPFAYPTHASNLPYML
jgi:glutathione reductase (NADPH)